MITKGLCVVFALAAAMAHASEQFAFSLISSPKTGQPQSLVIQRSQAGDFFNGVPVPVGRVVAAKLAALAAAGEKLTGPCSAGTYALEIKSSNSARTESGCLGSARYLELVRAFQSVRP